MNFLLLKSFFSLHNTYAYAHYYHIMSGLVQLTEGQMEALVALAELPEGTQDLRYFELHKLILEVVKKLKSEGKFEKLYKFLTNFHEIGEDNYLTGNASPQFPITDLCILEDMDTDEPYDVSFKLLDVVQD